MNNRLIEDTGADLIIHEFIEPVLQQTSDGVLTKAAMALMIPILSLSITNHAQAEAVSKKSKIEKKAESSSGAKKQKSNNPDAPKELAVMTVTTAVNRLNPLADTQSDPTYKSEFDKIEPVTLHTISQQDLDNVKFTDAYQVLNRVPGVSMSRNLRFPNGGRSYTANLMDGISVRDPLRGQVSDIENFDTDEIQRIEVTKGPASALFPSNAFGGVINVITKEPPEKPVRRVWIEGGANDTTNRLRGGGSAAGKLDDLGYRLSFNIWDVPSWRKNTGKSREVGSGKLSYQLDDDSKLTFRGEYKHEEKSEGNSLTEQQFNQNPQQATGYSSYANREALTFYLDYERMVGKDGFLKASYGARNDTGFDFASFSGPADNNYLDMDGKITYRHHFDLLDSYLTGGLETVNGNDSSKSYSANLLNPLAPGNTITRHYKIDKFQASPFVQAEVSPLPWMHLTGGARYDDISYDAHNVLDGQNNTSHFARFSPKSGITFDLPYEQKLWFNYSFGFAPPTPSLLFTNTIPDPNLQPELAENLEVGLRGSLMEDKFEYEVAYYNTDVKNYITNEFVGRQGSLDIFRSANAGKVNLQGLETSLRYSPIKYLRFEVAHTYSVNKYVQFIDGVNNYSGNTVVQSPEHMVNGRMTVMPIDKLNIEFEVNAMTDYYTNNNNALDRSGTYQRPAMFNLRTSYDFGPAELWLHVINLTDERAARVASAARGASVTRSYSSIEEPLTVYGGVAVKF
ncbi:MAG: TonB-dependent receptor [Methylobacter sp.]